MLGTALFFAGCTTGGSITTGPSTSSQPDRTPSTCQEAPPWLITAISESLTPRGASLSRIFVTRARELDGSDGTVEAWLTAAAISGAGVRPEVGIWLVDGLKAGSATSLRAMNASSQRYSRVPPGDAAGLAGSGVIAGLRACVGPMPEP